MFCQFYLKYIYLKKYWPDKTENPKIEEFQLKEGENKIYFKEENKYYFSIESCYEFKVEGIDGQNSFNIPSNIPLILTAISSSVSAFVQTDVEDNTLGMNLRFLFEFYKGSFCRGTLSIRKL